MYNNISRGILRLYFCLWNDVGVVKLYIDKLGCFVELMKYYYYYLIMLSI